MQAEEGFANSTGERMKFIDLFCGCGLFTEGMKQAGHTPVLGIDIWKTATDSYSSNHYEALTADILTLDISTLPKVDFIIGSPPCQSFSIANTKTRTCDTSLINKYIEIVNELKPKYFIMEEVPSAKDYVPHNWKKCILKATDFGGLQLRKRLYAGRFNDVLSVSNGRKKCPIVTTNWNRLTTNKNTKFSIMKEVNDFIGWNLPLEEVKQKAMFYMGVRSDYILCGSLREQIKQLGNGVFVPIPKALGEMLK